MNPHAMEYNSQKDHLVISEYGRNIQNLVRHVKSVEDKEERQKMIERIVYLIHQINPKSRNFLDQKEKLWRHIFRIAEFELDVDTPEGKIPTAEDSKLNPEMMEYPDVASRFRHYGRNVQTLVKKAVDMEDGEKKTEFIRIIGSYMKMAYMNWSRQSHVNDDVIINDLRALSDNQLTIADDISLNYLGASVMRPRPPQTRTNNNRRNSGSNNNRRKNNNNQRRKPTHRR